MDSESASTSSRSAMAIGWPLPTSGGATGWLASARRPGKAWKVCLLPVLLLLLLAAG